MLSSQTIHTYLIILTDNGVHLFETYLTNAEIHEVHYNTFEQNILHAFYQQWGPPSLNLNPILKKKCATVLGGTL